jgi:NDP-sugar pyrophosphorylase family protein
LIIFLYEFKYFNISGGYAKRFKPLSDYVPKPLFPVGGVPLIYYIIEKALETGSDEIIISTNKNMKIILDTF